MKHAEKLKILIVSSEAAPFVKSGGLGDVVGSLPKALKELGAKEVYLYISHCENSIFEGELLKSDWVDRVFTTNSIFAGEHEKVEVFDYE